MLALPHAFLSGHFAPLALDPFARARPARRAEGAPLIIVKKVLTASALRRMDRTTWPGYGCSGQSNRAQMVRLV